MREIKTNRLLLRNWEKADCAALFEYAQLPEVALNAGWKPHKNFEDSLDVISNIYPNNCFAVELKEENKIIGNIGFHETSLCGEAKGMSSRELGFNLNPKYWSKGYMHEAATAVCDFLFNELCVDYIWLAHFPENQRSERICKKLGFRYLFNRAQAVPQLDNEIKQECFYIKLNPNIFSSQLQIKSS